VSKEKFEWRSIQRYLSPQATDDLNKFLEKLPQNVGSSVLIAAGIAWAAAGAIGIYTTMQVRGLTELRAELAEVNALKPHVPILKDIAVNKNDIENFIGRMEVKYPDLTFSATGNTVLIVGKDTNTFAQFREALGHIQNGGNGWKIKLDNMCVGRECDKDKLRATIKINQVRVEMP